MQDRGAGTVADRAAMESNVREIIQARILLDTRTQRRRRLKRVHGPHLQRGNEAVVANVGAHVYYRHRRPEQPAKDRHCTRLFAPTQEQLIFTVSQAGGAQPRSVWYTGDGKRSRSLPECVFTPLNRSVAQVEGDAPTR